MPLDGISSSPAPPPGASLQEELDFYKSQYEQLEAELRDFQESSKDLEAELEKDIAESEANRRKLNEKVENLGFDVNTWRSKYNQSREEASSAQGVLQKEITELRDQNRTLNLRLRDTEVANDDYERQARNTTSSLEDLELKYNVAIERGVLLEEEIKGGEQEREALRIENQRVREELGDLKIEAEIIQERLRLTETEVNHLHEQRVVSAMRRPPSSDGEGVRPRTSSSDISTEATDLSSPTVSTPPRQKAGMSPVTGTPPSPPLSDAAPAKVNASPAPITPVPAKRRTTTATPATAAPRTVPRLSTANNPSALRAHPRHSRGPSIPMATNTPSARRTPAMPASSHRPRPSISNLPAPTQRQPSVQVPQNEPLPRSGSLYQIRGLITKMSKLEARVHSARSKLPAPTTTPPRASPRQASGMHASTPSAGSSAAPVPGTSAAALSGNITVRRSGRDRRSRASNSTTTSGAFDGHSSRPVSRLSFGITSAAAQERERDAPARPTSALSNSGRPPSATGHRPPSASGHRPSSVASHYSQSGSSVQFARPPSRSGGRTPLGNYAEHRRPGSRTGIRTSISSRDLSASVSAHSHSASISGPIDEALMTTPRRSTFGKSVDASAIPTPSGLPRRKSGFDGLHRRESAGGSFSSDGGGSQGGGEGAMGPPTGRRKLSEVGETF